MARTLSSFLVASVIFLALDAVWLIAVASPLYRDELGDRIAEEPDLAAGAAFYVLYMAALLWFAILPGLRTGALRTAAVNGAVLGAAAYGTWALTNRAVLTDWPWALVPVDIAWGTALSAVTAMLTVALLRSRLTPA